MALFQNFLNKIIDLICETIFYDKSLIHDKRSSQFVISQINKSPFHIKYGLVVLTVIFTFFGIFFGLLSKSFYKKIRYIENFENFCKTTRMYVSFIRSMSLIYACDNNLI
jgi:hypothetical protein